MRSGLCLRWAESPAPDVHGFLRASCGRRSTNQGGTEISALEGLDVPVRDLGLLRLALRHRSATDDPVTNSYERLEFFGDSILGLIIAQYLYEHFPEWDQGMLSKAKATIVQEAPLAEAATRLGLQNFIEVSATEAAAMGHMRAAVLADVFEAIIGAIYIEQGLPIARWFVLEHLNPYLEEVARGRVAAGDFKSKLQEVAQARWRSTPIYRQVGEAGDPHSKQFVIEVVLDGEVMGSGTGRSKKEAEQAAARDALELIERFEALRASRSEGPVERH
ncbi:MAG: ribonuclease III [Armatimonadetes bacterium]|nr:ribonuclease III [Armatimonadota bacterium]